MSLDCVSVHKQVGQYPAILISRLVNNPYVWNLVPRASLLSETCLLISAENFKHILDLNVSKNSFQSIKSRRPAWQASRHTYNSKNLWECLLCCQLSFLYVL